MDAAVIMFHWSFFAEKTPKLKISMDAYFQHCSLLFVIYYLLSVIC